MLQGVWTIFRACFKTRKSRDGESITLTTDFFTSLREKIIPMLWTITFIRMMARVFIQRKQPYCWFIANNVTKTCYEEDTAQTITFWILAETFIRTIYIVQLQLHQPVHKLKMGILRSQCTNETTQTTVDTTLTTNFWILAKIFMHTIWKLQREQPVYRFKAKTLMSLCTNETTQTTIFLIYNNRREKLNQKDA